MTTTTKRKPYEQRLAEALRDLINQLAQGREFPDIDWSTADKHQVYRDDLVDAYDNRKFR